MTVIAMLLPLNEIVILKWAPKCGPLGLFQMMWETWAPLLGEYSNECAMSVGVITIPVIFL